jgi:hypothetical protein
LWLRVCAVRTPKATPFTLAVTEVRGHEKGQVSSKRGRNTPEKRWVMAKKKAASHRTTGLKNKIKQEKKTAAKKGKKYIPAHHRPSTGGNY